MAKRKDACQIDICYKDIEHVAKLTQVSRFGSHEEINKWLVGGKDGSVITPLVFRRPEILELTRSVLGKSSFDSAGFIPTRKGSNEIVDSILIIFSNDIIVDSHDVLVSLLFLRKLVSATTMMTNMMLAEETETNKLVIPHVLSSFCLPKHTNFISFQKIHDKKYFSFDGDSLEVELIEFSDKTKKHFLSDLCDSLLLRDLK